jgi:MFS family permease
MLGVALGLCAVGLGAGMTVSYTVAGLVVPAGAHGSAFGVLSAAWLAGLAVSPIVSGLLAALHLRLVFWLNLGVLALTALAVGRAMKRSSR